MRLFFVLFCLTVLFSASWLIFGDRFEMMLLNGEAVAWLRRYGAWAWAAGMALIVADLLLPIPATVVMAALGMIYGPWLGGVLGGTASVIAGATAYGATRLLGHRAAVFLVGERDLRRAELFFSRAGGYAVALSRPLPLLPEVIACLAGLARMRTASFFAALCCGSLPIGFIFAGVGSLAQDQPRLAMALVVVVPVLLWPIAGRILNSSR